MKKMTVFFLLGIILVLGLMMAACNSSDSGGGFSNVDVQYTISGDKITHNANLSRTYTVPGVGTDFWELTWFCGNYNGQINKGVKLTFKKNNNNWVLDKEEINAGSCG